MGPTGIMCWQNVLAAGVNSGVHVLVLNLRIHLHSPECVEVNHGDCITIVILSL